MFITGLYSVANMENIKHCYNAIGLIYLSNQENKTAKFAVQVCGSEKSFAVAEVQKISASVLQTCEICGCGIEFKFAVPSSAEKCFNCSARGQRSVVLDKQFL